MAYLEELALHLPLPLLLLDLPQVSPPLGVLLLLQTGLQCPLSVHTLDLLLPVLLSAQTPGHDLVTGVVPPVEPSLRPTHKHPQRAVYCVQTALSSARADRLTMFLLVMMST